MKRLALVLLIFASCSLQSEAQDLIATKFQLQTVEGFAGEDSPVLQPTVGQMLFPTFYFQYNGNTVSPAQAAIRLNGGGHCSTSFDSFENGFMYVMWCGEWTAEAGTHTFEGVADPNSMVAETNENNNTASVQYVIQGNGPVPTPTPSLPGGPVVDGLAAILFQFAADWTNAGFTVQDLLASLNGDFVLPTATPTMPGSDPTPTPTATEGGGGSTFDYEDYFPLASANTWHYTGIMEGSTDDDFRWTVEAAGQDIGGGNSAARFRTDTDEPTDDRNGYVDFWYNDGTGQVFFYGVQIPRAFSASLATVNAQTIVLSDPVLVGRNGLMIGDQVADTGAGTVNVTSPLGTTDLPFTINATVDYLAFLPTFETPLGTFTDVLKIEITIIANVLSPIGLVPFDLITSTFFLKEGVGVIAHDQEPDQNDAEKQGIDDGTVNGSAVVAN